MSSSTPFSASSCYARCSKCSSPAHASRLLHSRCSWTNCARTNTDTHTPACVFTPRRFLWYLVAFVFYSTKIPEKLRPGLTCRWWGDISQSAHHVMWCSHCVTPPSLRRVRFCSQQPSALARVYRDRYFVVPPRDSSVLLRVYFATR